MLCFLKRSRNQNLARKWNEQRSDRPGDSGEFWQYPEESLKAPERNDFARTAVKISHGRDVVELRKRHAFTWSGITNIGGMACRRAVSSHVSNSGALLNLGEIPHFTLQIKLGLTQNLNEVRIEDGETRKAKEATKERKVKKNVDNRARMRDLSKSKMALLEMRRFRLNCR